MSRAIHADTYENAASDQLGADALHSGTIKAWGNCDSAGVERHSGTFNVTSITDAGTGGKSFSLAHSFDAIPNYCMGRSQASSFANSTKLLYPYLNSTTFSSTSAANVMYYGSTAYQDAVAAFNAIGDLA